PVARSRPWRFPMISFPGLLRRSASAPPPAPRARGGRIIGIESLCDYFLFAVRSFVKGHGFIRAAKRLNIRRPLGLCPQRLKPDLSSAPHGTPEGVPLPSFSTDSPCRLHLGLGKFRQLILGDLAAYLAGGIFL